MVMDALGIMLDLSRFDLFQKVSNPAMIGHSDLNPHRVQTLHRGLAHATADEILTIAQIVELGHVSGIPPHAMVMIMMVIVIMMVVMMLTRIWEFP